MSIPTAAEVKKNIESSSTDKKLLKCGLQDLRGKVAEHLRKVTNESELNVKKWFSCECNLALKETIFSVLEEELLTKGFKVQRHMIGQGLGGRNFDFEYLSLSFEIIQPIVTNESAKDVEETTSKPTSLWEKLVKKLTQ